MSNKIFTPFILLFIFIISSCATNGDDGNTKISGTIKNASGSTIVLESLTPTAVTGIDSTQINSEGKFEITANVTEPGYYRIRLSNGQFVNLVLQKQDNVIITADANNLGGTYEVKGSKQSEALKRLNDHVQQSMQEVNELEQQFTEARNNNHPNLDSLQKTLQSEYMLLMAQREKDVKNYIDTNSGSLTLLAALGYLDAEQNFETYKKVSEDLAQKYPNSSYVNDLSTRVKDMSKIAIGSEAPEIAMNNPAGKTVPLSSLRGKYVLIDFWAAWCGPCRAENPHLVKVYDKFKDKNFEIYGVSLDANKDAWLKAINDDKLPWVHVSDLQRWNSPVVKQYNISGIPFSVLLDPDGKIIAKGLRSAALEQQLNQIFK